MFDTNAFLEKYEINDGLLCVLDHFVFNRSALVGKTGGIYDMNNVWLQFQENSSIGILVQICSNIK